MQRKSVKYLNLDESATGSLPILCHELSNNDDHHRFQWTELIPRSSAFIFLSFAGTSPSDRLASCRQPGGTWTLACATSTIPTKALASGLAASSINFVNRALGLIPLLVASAMRSLLVRGSKSTRGFLSDVIRG